MVSESRAITSGRAKAAAAGGRKLRRRPIAGQHRQAGESHQGAASMPGSHMRRFRDKAAEKSLTHAWLLRGSGTTRLSVAEKTKDNEKKKKKTMSSAY